MNTNPIYKPRMLSLCSGIGAIDLAAVLAGCEIAGQVEIDPFGRAVLLKNFGEMPRPTDIKEVATYDAKTLFSTFGAIDIMAGGIPCQPFSAAGQRRGVEDDRHLWPYAFAIIKKARPAWVLIENVRGFISLALDLVLSDLESEDYEARAVILPACAVGAPHIRERCFILAYLPGERSGAWRTQPAGLIGQSNADGSGTAGSMAHTSRTERGALAQRWNVVNGNDAGWQETTSRSQPRSKELADTNGAGWQEQYTSTVAGEVGHVARRKIAPGNGVADAQHWGREWRMFDTFQPGATLLRSGAGAGTELESGVGRDAHGATSWLDGHIWPALPGEAQRPQEPPRTITGKQPNRNKRLKALGNAVVWQQVYPFFAFITQHYAAHL